MSNQSSAFPYVCASCNKEMVAGAFPKWFCLHTNCNNYLKPITKNYVLQTKENCKENQF